MFKRHHTGSSTIQQQAFTWSPNFQPSASPHFLLHLGFLKCGASLVPCSLWNTFCLFQGRRESGGPVYRHLINLCFAALCYISTFHSARRPHSWALLGLWGSWIRLSCFPLICSPKAFRSFNFLLLWLFYLLFIFIYCGSNYRSLLISKTTFLFLILLIVLGDNFPEEKRTKTVLFCHFKATSFPYMFLCLYDLTEFLAPNRHSLTTRLMNDQM